MQETSLVITIINISNLSTRDGQGKLFFPDYHDHLVPGRVMSRQCAGPGGGRANCGDVGGFARADIHIEHYEHNPYLNRLVITMITCLILDIMITCCLAINQLVMMGI